MSAVAIGLAGAGLGILAAAARHTFASGLLLTGAGIAALVLFATAPSPFAATLLASLAAIAIWVAQPPGGRVAGALAAGACGLLCAAVAPHLAVLAAELPIGIGWKDHLVRPVVALGAVVVGAGIAGPGGGAFAIVACALALGLLDPGTATGWLIPAAAIGASVLARSSPRGAITVLIAISLLTLPRI